VAGDRFGIIVQRYARQRVPVLIGVNRADPLAILPGVLFRVRPLPF
jgi:hypothetical protein